MQIHDNLREDLCQDNHPAAWAVSREVIRGKGSGVLAPGSTGTRAEAASMLMGFAEAET